MRVIIIALTFLISATSSRNMLPFRMLKWLQIVFENGICSKAYFNNQYYNALVSNAIFTVCERGDDNRVTVITPMY